MIGRLLNRNKSKLVITKKDLGNLLLKGEVNKNGIKINLHNDYNGMCWMCGKHKYTKHHVIPQSYNPLFNIKIPVCRDCHDFLHDIYSKNAQIKRMIDSRASLQANKIVDKKYKSLLKWKRKLKEQLNNSKQVINEMEQNEVNIMMENNLLRRLIEGDGDE